MIVLKIIAMIYVTMWLSILAHELGHLLCATACQRKAMSFRVGSGKSLKFKILSVNVEFGRQPFGGGVVYTRSVDWRKTIITALGGPLANAAIAILCIPMLIAGVGWMAWTIFIINAFYVIEDSIPIGNSDGMQIKKTFARKRMREQDYVDYLARNP